MGVAFPQFQDAIWINNVGVRPCDVCFNLIVGPLFSKVKNMLCLVPGCKGDADVDCQMYHLRESYAGLK